MCQRFDVTENLKNLQIFLQTKQAPSRKTHARAGLPVNVAGPPRKAAGNRTWCCSYGQDVRFYQASRGHGQCFTLRRTRVHAWRRRLSTQIQKSKSNTTTGHGYPTDYSIPLLFLHTATTTYAMPFEASKREEEREDDDYTGNILWTTTIRGIYFLQRYKPI
jgi:hypothetical protein